MTRRTPQGSWVFVDGAPQPGETARVSVYDRGLLYGDSVYEVTRTVGGRPLWLREHLRRLATSAAGLLMTLPPPEAIEAAVAQTLAAAGVGAGAEAYLRIVVTRGAGELSLDPAAADEPNLLVYVKPLRLPEPRLYEEGVALLVADERRNAPGHVPAWVKSGNYLTSVLASAAARQAGAYEALLTDVDGQVMEGASSNLLWARGGRLQTTPLSAGILAGITRGVVLALARDAAAGRAGAAPPRRGDEAPAAPHAVDEELLTPQELLQVDEALLTSSVRGVMPVVALVLEGKRVPIGTGRPGPVTRWLLDAYAARLVKEAGGVASTG